MTLADLFSWSRPTHPAVVAPSEEALRRAYAEGYERGMQDAQKILALMSAKPQGVA